MSHTHLDGTSRVGRFGAPKAHLRLSCEHDCDGAPLITSMLRDTCTPSIDQGLTCGVGKLGSSSTACLIARTCVMLVGFVP